MQYTMDAITNHTLVYTDHTVKLSGPYSTVPIKSQDGDGKLYGMVWCGLAQPRPNSTPSAQNGNLSFFTFMESF